MSDKISVTKCPDCDTEGRYDGRVLIGGRGVYICPSCGSKWQDVNEKPSNKGAIDVSGINFDSLVKDVQRKLQPDLDEMARKRRRTEASARDIPLA